MILQKRKERRKMNVRSPRKRKETNKQKREENMSKTCETKGQKGKEAIFGRVKAKTGVEIA